MILLRAPKIVLRFSVWRFFPGECLTRLVAERAFPTSDYWGRTGVAGCAEEMTGICRDFQ